MAWNEPGGNGSGNGDKDKDPWGPRKKNDGPPDLDEVLKNLKKKINGWFGGGGKGGKGGKSGSGSGGGSGIGLTLLIIIGLVVWAGTGFYSVDQAARGVVQRFGVPAQETTGPGLHWHLPYPIEKVTVVDVDRNREYNFKRRMLTKDEKLVTISINVNYSIGDITKFMFANDDPIKTLEEALDSSVREVLSTLVLEEVLGQQEIAAHRSKSQLRQCNIIYDNDPIVNPAARISKIAKAKGKTAKVVKSTRITDIKVIAPLVKVELVKLLKKYKTGITINSVNFQKPQPPSAEVSDAFEDVIRAQEDATRYVEAAWGYCQQIVNTAHGEKDKILKDAEAYKQRKVLDARGEVSRFKQVLVEYERAPEVTRRRLYLETQELILSRVSKIFIKSKSGGNIMMLPLDKFLQGATGQKPGSLLK